MSKTLDEIEMLLLRATNQCADLARSVRINQTWYLPIQLYELENVISGLKSLLDPPERRRK